MSFDPHLCEWATEALEPLGTVTLRKMMGAAVLYLDGTIFAVVDDEIWFKADAQSAAIWDAEGCDRFTFTEKDGTVQTMNYRRAPSEVCDDAEAMQRWAALAVEAGSRGGCEEETEELMSAAYPLTKSFPDSSAIERAAYYPGTQALDIWYEGGNHYSYYGVPPSTYQQLLAAESAGEFVNRQIKPRFEYRRRSSRRFRG